VTGASDKTLRQWDLTTGQCVMTMDILWAISHPPTATPGSAHSFSGSSPASGAFGIPMHPYADGTHDTYEDFVGGVQFWGYGLVSGSGDGAVRMWDSKLLNSFVSLLRADNVLQCALGRLTGHC
jgi:division protein 1